jgi:hypothetical protein
MSSLTKFHPYLQKKKEIKEKKVVLLLLGTSN